MKTLACKFPLTPFTIAVSGGVDSMSLLGFCMRGRKKFSVLHINHGTPHAAIAEEFVKDFCGREGINFIVRHTKTANHNHAEKVWRDERQEFYAEFINAGISVLTAATLDDLVEWYVFTSARGNARFMKPVNTKTGLLKPFLYTKKTELYEFAEANNIPFVVDETNFNGTNARAVLRREVIPGLLKVNPGLYTTVLNRARQQPA